ncbi:hypothetical protein K502DRAFT_350383 [Neoconidiobolus thromboides FSU 785]|nr:hypothetical protein K502DRAFT_350383 [Neoconidiobolus thromboides FSU 785]
MSRLFFGHLARDVKEKDIEKLLRPYGPVRDIYVRDGFGFVEFNHFKDADDCIRELNGSDFFGERMIVEHARTRRERERERFPINERRRDGRGPPVRTPNRIILENLPFSSSWQDIKDFVRPVAECSFADVHKYRRGEGILEFHTYGDMKTVLEKLQGAEFGGNRIHMIEAPVHNFGRGGFRRDERPPFMGSSRFNRSPRHERSPRRGRSPFRGRSPRRERSGSPRRPERSPRFANGRSPPRFENGRSPPRFGGPRSPGRFEGMRSPGRYEAPRSPGRFERPRSPGRYEPPRSPSRFERPRSPGRYNGPHSPIRHDDRRTPPRGPIGPPLGNDRSPPIGQRPLE